MTLSTSTVTLAPGSSRTYSLAPGEAVTVATEPNCYVTVTETPDVITTADQGGQTNVRTSILQYKGEWTYGPYALGGTVAVAVSLSKSTSSVSVTLGSAAAEVVGAAGNANPALPLRIAQLLASAGCAVKVGANGRVSLSGRLENLVPLPATVEDTVYWVSTTGSDASNGSTKALAKRNIHAAITAGNTAAVPYTINILPGIYWRGENFNNGTATVQPSQACRIRAPYGQVVCLTASKLTWSVATAPRYTATRSNVKRIVDLLNYDENGDYVELTLVASEAAVSATPGTWYTDNTSVWVHRADGAAVADANTAALMTVVNGIENTSSGNMWVEGIYQVGGVEGCIRARNNTSGRLFIDECRFSHNTNATGSDQVIVLNIELVVARNSSSNGAQRDGWDITEFSGDVANGVFVDCVARNSGTVTTTTSNNGFTNHSGSAAICINCDSSGSAGAEFACEGSGTVMVCAGTSGFGGVGDIAAGGVVPTGIGYQAVNTSELYRVMSFGVSLQTTGGQVIEI